ncbi:hypothetical protein [Nocardioides aurantiacus]|uniref:Uncharacterized protein n=1 Tax=Nocardioides aurantiacus TaxID=86796 RepID=A0A3N2CWU4_9ACTN|nr:hypothetical protein [Nocardioides aurantiacus]ROR91946.1 hypothetical protein EDD33_2827 [Nocardioides aurantiacus]
MSDLPPDDDLRPEVRWATHVGPDFLALQLPPVPVDRDGAAHDAMKKLFGLRGFRAVVETDELDLQPANGCLLTRTGRTRAELLLRLGGQDASRIPLHGLDRAWLSRAVKGGQAAVLLVEAAVGPDGTVTREDLRRDVDAGVVLAALVPAGDA